MTVSDSPPPGAQALGTLEPLRAAIVAEAEAQLASWPAVRSAFLSSVRNLAHYLALRRRDLRELQLALMPLGLSSLGRCESRVLPNIDAVIAALRRIAGEDAAAFPAPEAFFAGQRALAGATAELFGPAPPGRSVYIMVTLSPEAARDPALVEQLIAAGTNVVRINCAHDDVAAWEAMAENTRAASRKLGRPCAVYADIAGPKLRIESVRCASGDPQPRLHAGDRVLLGGPDVTLQPPYALAVASSVAGLATRLRDGAQVGIDDGKALGTVCARADGALVVEFHTVRAKGIRLRPLRGLNFPDADLGLDVLGEKDLRDLDFIVARADMAGFSFVNRAEDVMRLRREIGQRARQRSAPLGIVLKIETREGVANLPDLIVAAGATGPVGVMIARGDLAVNIGYRRLAEIQEEILWLCEAACVPVIWATQVLERLVKKGEASRGEFTDAAMAERAECVMLNKGPHALEAVGVLADVLGRMEGHQLKKTSRLRPLHAWD